MYDSEDVVYGMGEWVYDGMGVWQYERQCMVVMEYDSTGVMSGIPM